jgi:hypothetical protein
MSGSTPVNEWHPGWGDLLLRVAKPGVSRRSFIRGAAAAAAGIAASPLVRFARGRADGVGPATPGVGVPDLASWPVHTGSKIKHVVVLCQENRSFDHYFGKFASAELGTTGNRPAVFDPATAYSGTNSQSYRPFHIEYFCDFDPDHGWDASHTKWNDSAMDGWVRGDGDEPFALGYYDAADHIYHVQLAQAFTMADHYFCSQIGPTLPNRLYLWTGTSGWGHLGLSSTGGLPFNNPSISSAPPVLSWPTMADTAGSSSAPQRSRAGCRRFSARTRSSRTRRRPRSDRRARSDHAGLESSGATTGKRANVAAVPSSASEVTKTRISCLSSATCRKLMADAR